MPLTFLVGGARSGKSTIAVELASAFRGPVTFVATGEPRDEEMAARIDEHRASRPPSWTTVEAPVRLADAVANVDDGSCVILDCLTLWVSNAIEAGADDAAILHESAVLASDLASRAAAPSIVVSNEVGSGIVPLEALSRRYRDLLGRVNATVASCAGSSYLVVAGRALRLESPT